jgi:hypothetical protein
MKRPRLSGIPSTFLVIPSKVEESLAVFGAILTEIESEMFRFAQHDNAVYVQAGLIPRDK